MANKAGLRSHMASSSWPYPPRKLLCHHCFKPMSRWNEPCFRGLGEASDEGKP